MYKSDLAERPLNDAPAKASQSFDYTTLDSETRAMVLQYTCEVKGLIKPQPKDIVEAGQKLIAVKHRLGHGRFGTWLQAEFGPTSRTAQKFMRVAEVFKNEEIFKNEYYSDLNIAPAALYHLAESSTPNKARQEAVNRAYQGESITCAKAKAIIDQYKPSAKLKPNNTVRSASHKALPHLPLVSAPSAVVIDIPAETVSVQEPTLLSSQEKEGLLNQQRFPIPTEQSHQNQKRLTSNQPVGLTKQIRAPTQVEPAKSELPKEPLSAQIHISNIDWHELRLLDNAQTLKIPLCLWVEGPSYVLPALLKQIRENPDIRSLMSNEFSNLIKVIAELVA